MSDEEYVNLPKNLLEKEIANQEQLARNSERRNIVRFLQDKKLIDESHAKKLDSIEFQKSEDIETLREYIKSGSINQDLMHSLIDSLPEKIAYSFSTYINPFTQTPEKIAEELLQSHNQKVADEQRVNELSTHLFKWMNKDIEEKKLQWSQDSLNQEEQEPLNKEIEKQKQLFQEEQKIQIDSIDNRTEKDPVYENLPFARKSITQQNADSLESGPSTRQNDPVEEIYSTVQKVMGKKANKSPSTSSSGNIRLANSSGDYAEIEDADDHLQPPPLPDRAYPIASLNKKLGLDIFTKLPKDMDETDIKAIYPKLVQEDIGTTFREFLPQAQKDIYDRIEKISNVEWYKELRQDEKQNPKILKAIAGRMNSAEITETYNDLVKMQPTLLEQTKKNIDQFYESLSDSQKPTFNKIKENKFIDILAKTNKDLADAGSRFGVFVFNGLVGESQNSQIAEQFAGQLKNDILRTSGQILETTLYALDPFLNKEQQEQIVSLRDRNSKEIKSLEAELLTIDPSKGNEIAEKRESINKKRFENALEYANTANEMIKISNPDVYDAINSITDNVKSNVASYSLDRTKDSDRINEIAEKYMSDSIIKGLYFSESNIIAQKNLSIPITKEIRDFFIKNPKLIQGQKAPPSLQNCVNDIFGSQNDKTKIDPEKLKEPTLQSKFSEQASRNVNAFILTQKALEKSGLTEYQEEKITKSLIKPLMNLDIEKLDSSQKQALVDYTSEKLQDHTTFMSKIRSNDSRIAEAELEKIIPKIQQKYRELETPIIGEIIEKSGLKLNSHQREKITNHLLEEVNSVRDVVNPPSNLVDFVADKLKKNSKGLLSDKVKTKALEDIKQSISKEFGSKSAVVEHYSSDYYSSVSDDSILSRSRQGSISSNSSTLSREDSAVSRSSEASELSQMQLSKTDDPKKINQELHKHSRNDFEDFERKMTEAGYIISDTQHKKSKGKERIVVSDQISQEPPKEKPKAPPSFPPPTVPPAEFEKMLKDGTYPTISQKTQEINPTASYENTVELDTKPKKDKTPPPIKPRTHAPTQDHSSIQMSKQDILTKLSESLSVRERIGLINQLGSTSNETRYVPALKPGQKNSGLGRGTSKA